MSLSLLEKTEKIAAILGVCATIAIAFIGYSIDETNRRREKEEKQIAVVAQIGPLLLDPNLNKRRFALRVIAAEGTPDYLCPAIADAASSVSADITISQANVSNCKQKLQDAAARQLVAATAINNPAQRTAAVDAIAQNSPPQTLTNIATLSTDQQAATEARKLLDDRYNVIVVSYPTATMVNANMPFFVKKLQNTDLTPKCFQATHPGGAYGISVLLDGTLEAAKKALDTARSVGLDGYIHGTGPYHSPPNAPQLCAGI